MAELLADGGEKCGDDFGILQVGLDVESLVTCIFRSCCPRHGCYPVPSGREGFDDAGSYVLAGSKNKGDLQWWGYGNVLHKQLVEIEAEGRTTFNSVHNMALFANNDAGVLEQLGLYSA